MVESPTTQGNFDSAVASISDADSLMNLALPFLHYRCQTFFIHGTTKQERRTLQHLKWFTIDKDDIDRLYHIARKDAGNCEYFELLVRLKKSISKRLKNKHLYSYIYAEYDDYYFGHINGLIFTTEKIELLLAIIVQERPRKIYTCDIIYPCRIDKRERVSNTVHVHQSSNKFDNLLVKKDSRIIREFSLELPVLENLQEILNLLRKDGTNVDPVFIDKKLLKKKSKKFQKKIEDEKNNYYYQLGKNVVTSYEIKEDCNNEALLQTLYCKPFI